MQYELKTPATAQDVFFAVEHIQNAASPVGAMKELVLSEGGYWFDEDPKATFEICLLGLVGVGLGVQAATDDWLNKARRVCAPVSTN